MQVVILAAGRGSRFGSTHNTPKPLIEVAGVPMLVHALRQAQAITLCPVMLCPDEIYRSVVEHAELHRGLSKVRVIPVSHTQNGAACTLLAATAALNEQEPVLVMDVDNIINPDIVVNFSVNFELSNAMSSLLCFESTDASERYSFVGSDYPGYVTRVIEKKRISSIASCGVHAFRSWSVLRLGIAGLLHSGHTTNGEFYLAPVHNYMLQLGTVTYDLMPEAEFHCVGTPAQLEAYERTVSHA